MIPAIIGCRTNWTLYFFCCATRIAMMTSRIVLSLIRDRARTSEKERKRHIKEREFVFNQGQILIWHVLARVIKYNHQKAHHLFFSPLLRNSSPLLLTPQKAAPFLPSFRLVLALSNWISSGERRGWEDEGEGCLGNDRGFLDVVTGATCNQRPLNMRQEPQRRGWRKSEKEGHLIIELNESPSEKK